MFYLHRFQLLAIGIRIAAAHEDGLDERHVLGHLGERHLQRVLVLDELHLVAPHAVLDKVVDLLERIVRLNVEHRYLAAVDVPLGAVAHQQIEQHCAVLAAIEAEYQLSDLVLHQRLVEKFVRRADATLDVVPGGVCDDYGAGGIGIIVIVVSNIVMAIGHNDLATDTVTVTVIVVIVTVAVTIAVVLFLFAECCGIC